MFAICHLFGAGWHICRVSASRQLVADVQHSDCYHHCDLSQVMDISSVLLVADWSCGWQMVLVHL